MRRFAVLLVLLGLTGLFVGCQKKASAPAGSQQPAATSSESTGASTEQSATEQAPAGEESQATESDAGQGESAEQSGAQQ